jgi:hypothetical protein
MAALMEQLEGEEEAIQLTHTEFTFDEFSAFARELRDIETVKSLFLRSNKITDDMVATLAEALKRNKSIKEIYLSENSIGDQGAIALAKAISMNKTLELLHLNENSITDFGAEHLMHALEMNTSLRCLFLLKNPITIDTSLEHKVELRQEYARMLALCSLGVPRLAKKSNVYALPNDVLRLVRGYLSSSWSDGFNARPKGEA